MTSNERLRTVLAGRATDRPLFCPAVYEHKARLIERSPSEVARDGRLVEQAVVREYELYRPDLLTVGIDVYNVEAEAMGGTVMFPDQEQAVPIIVERLLDDPSQLDRLCPVDPESSGRMPLFLEAASRLHARLGDQVCIRGSLSGPYSVAAELLGAEPLMMACITQPEEVDRLLEACASVVVAYGCAFLKRGVEVCLFDSQTAPPLMSPRTYRELVLPHVKRLVAQLRAAGATFVEYVVGGNTTPNIDNLIETSCDILLCDFSADIDAYLTKLDGTSRLVRWNINPIVIERDSFEEMQKHVFQVINKAKDHARLLIGTGVLSYATDPKRIQEIRRMMIQAFDHS